MTTPQVINSERTAPQQAPAEAPGGRQSGSSPRLSPLRNALVGSIVIAAVYFGEAAGVVMLAKVPADAEVWRPAQPSVASVVITVVCLALLSPLLEVRPKTIRSHFLWWALATVLVPAWVLKDWSTAFRVEVMSAATWYVTVGFLVLLFVAKVASPEARGGTWGRAAGSLSLILVGACLAISLAALVIMVGIPNLSDLGLDAVYAKRAAFVDGLPPLAARIIYGINYVLIPLAVVLGMRFRRLSIVFAGLLAAVSIYAWMATKESLIIPLSSLGLYLLYTYKGRRNLFTFPSALALLACVPALLSNWGSDALMYYVTRRVLLVPTYTMMGHVQLGMDLAPGSRSDPYWLYSAVTGLGRWDTVRYGSYAVGDMLDPGTQLNANSHFLAFPVMWSSTLAVVLVALLTMTIVCFLDFAATGGDASIAVPLGMQVLMVLSTSYLLFALVSGGVLIALPLLRLLPRPDDPLITSRARIIKLPDVRRWLRR